MISDERGFFGALGEPCLRNNRGEVDKRVEVGRRGDDGVRGARLRPAPPMSSSRPFRDVRRPTICLTRLASQRGAGGAARAPPKLRLPKTVSMKVGLARALRENGKTCDKEAPGGTVSLRCSCSTAKTT